MRFLEKPIVVAIDEQQDSVVTYNVGAAYSLRSNHRDREQLRCVLSLLLLSKKCNDVVQRCRATRLLFLHPRARNKQHAHQTQETTARPISAVADLYNRRDTKNSQNARKKAQTDRVPDRCIYGCTGGTTNQTNGAVPATEDGRVDAVIGVCYLRASIY